MIPVRIACALVVAVNWHAWWLLADRLEGASLMTAVTLAAVLAWRFGVERDARVSVTKLAVLVSACAVAMLGGVPLLEMGVAVTALVVLLCPTRGWAAPGLAALALPVLPTLDFLLAWPLRRVSVVITAGLLRLNGMAVQVEGVAIDWHGERLLFDGPCSGVRMLWAALMLASIVALVRRLDARGYAAMLGMAVVAAVLGNALRAASLFYLENGFVAGMRGPAWHEAVGIMAFAMIAAVVVALAPQTKGHAA